MELDADATRYLEKILWKREFHEPHFLVLGKSLRGKISRTLRIRTDMNGNHRIVRCLFFPFVPDCFMGIVVVPFHALYGLAKVCNVPRKYIAKQFKRVKHGS